MSEFYPFAPRESQLEEYREDARRSFSRIGWACLAMMLVMQGGAALLMLGCQLLAMRGSRFMIAFIQSEWFQWSLPTRRTMDWACRCCCLFCGRCPCRPPRPAAG